ncbi:uncharacterized protein LOC123550126 [Mercenaria mercenaria]|uniref:uncharacterized protein LOC123550126 n=1 Tax=Mercenaria mercenaria TaxID=6596 RepID=UPI00234FA164|nr:uncharacterized protein LOC123550126 [Mercenaria mercenaria]
MDKSSDDLPILTVNSSTTSAGVLILETNATYPDDLLPPLQRGPGTPTFPSTSTKNLHIPGSYIFNKECTADDPARGVIRKYDEYKNETLTYTRQKACRCTHTSKPRGVKRKFASDHSEQPRKRFKAAPLEVKIVQSETETKPSVSSITSSDERNNVPNNDSSVIFYDSAESRDILHSQPVEGVSKDIPDEESRDAQSEQSDDEISCPRSCVCNIGHSRMPEPIERDLPTAIPLYRCLLIRRLYSLSNMKYTCCQSRCVRRYPRESAMRVSLRHMTEDYYDSDLRVTRYSWGEWKE